MDSVGLHTYETHRYAIVIFKKSADALKATLSQTHTINEYVARATLPDAFQKPINLLRMPDDCLLDIMGYLELKNLCSVASVCQRLQLLAQRVFSSKWKGTAAIVSSVEDAYDYLFNFGPIAEWICLVATAELPKSDHYHVLNLLMRHCSDALTRLDLYNISFEKNDRIIAESNFVFPGVKKLILNKCTISVKWFMKSCDLVELDLIKTHVTYNGVRHQSCPSLKTLKIRGSNTWVQKGLHLFLQDNRQLKTFVVVPFSSTYYGQNHTPYGRILDYVPETIECLTIAPIGTADFTRFESLKTLEIICDRYQDDDEFFDRLLIKETVECMQIDVYDEPNIAAIARLKHLKSLKLHYYNGFIGPDLFYIAESLMNLSQLVLGGTIGNVTFSANDLSTLIQLSPNLQFLGLSFAHNFERMKINAQVYRGILNTVEQRSNGKQLHIVILCFSNPANMFDATLSTHSSLKITCLDAETVTDIIGVGELHIELRFVRDFGIRMTDEVLKELYSRGLLDAVPEIEF